MTTQHYGNYNKSDRAFCDWACYTEWETGATNPQWCGGEFPYGPGWTEQKREQIRERDGRECYDCGMSEPDHIDEFGCKLHVHHIADARRSTNPAVYNAPRNLITLCHSCHKSKWDPATPEAPGGIHVLAD
jgi:5-methylcytosine-specific restriction endonuclease McrA